MILCHSGCGAVVDIDPSYCKRCQEELDALEVQWTVEQALRIHHAGMAEQQALAEEPVEDETAAPKKTAWDYASMFGCAALVGYVLYPIVEMFVDWILTGDVR